MFSSIKQEDLKILQNVLKYGYRITEIKVFELETTTGVTLLPSRPSQKSCELRTASAVTLHFPAFVSLCHNLSII